GRGCRCGRLGHLGCGPDRRGRIRCESRPQFGARRTTEPRLGRCTPMTIQSAEAGRRPADRIAALAARAIDPKGIVLVLLIAILPSFAEPGSLMRFLQRVAPVAVVAIGQYFVIVSGEFDLSMGAVVTAQVMTAGHLIGKDDAKTVPVLLLMLGIGVLIGIV